MTCNFKNSAGTDLDNLFYANYGNAGALGFKCSDGNDLGNRYISGSLGYNVGYKNSAGTDIGYLRGNLVAPSGSATLNTTYTKKLLATCDGYDPYAGLEGDYVTVHGYLNTINLNISLSSTNGAPINSVDVYLETQRKYERVYCGYWYYCNMNNTVPTASGSCDDYDDCMKLSISNYSSRIKNSSNFPKQTQTRVGLLGTISATNFPMTISFLKNDYSSAFPDCKSNDILTANSDSSYIKLRLAFYVYNAAGGSQLTSAEFNRE